MGSADCSGMMLVSVFRLSRFLLFLAGVALLALATLLPPVPSVEAQESFTAPGAPGDLVLALGNAKLVAGWNPPEDNGGAEVTAYAVQYKATAAADQDGVSGNPATGWVDGGHSGTGIDTEITGLTNAVGYDVRVRASNSEGDGQWSDTASATPHEDVIWSAILTVDVDNDYGDGAGTFGCVINVLNSNMDECPETLTEDEFALGTESYEWTQFSRYVAPGEAAQYTKVGLSALVPDDSNLREGRIQVGGELVSLADTSRVLWFVPDPGTYPNMQWIYSGFLLNDGPSTGPAWTEGQRVPLSLQARLPQVQVTDETPPGPDSVVSDATLSALAVSDGNNDVPITPAFASDTAGYTASVDNSVGSVTVTPTVNDPNATVTVEGSEVTSGTASSAIALTAGEPKAISVVVTAQDETVNTYAVSVTRAAAQESGLAFYILKGVLSDGSGGRLVRVNGLTISEGLSFAYFVRLQARPSANVTVAPANPSSAIWVNTGYDGLLVFTPENWASAQVVQVFTSPRAAEDENAGNITHTFSSDDSSYGGLTSTFTLDVVGTSSSCTWSAAPTLTVDDSNRFLSIGPSAASCGGTPIVGYDTAIKKDDGPWEFSANTRWAVPASATYSVRPVVNTLPVFSGSTYEVKTRGLTYNQGVSPWSPVSTITVEGVKSSDAYLQALFISPGEFAFDTDTTDYIVNVPQSATSVTISPLPNDYRATVNVDGVRAGPEFVVEVSLVEGEDKAIPVVVTAEDGVTTRTYTITVTREPGGL